MISNSMQYLSWERYGWVLRRWHSECHASFIVQIAFVLQNNINIIRTRYLFLLYIFEDFCYLHLYADCTRNRFIFHKLKVSPGQNTF
jgi:hypothetical protein